MNIITKLINFSLDIIRKTGYIFYVNFKKYSAINKMDQAMGLIAKQIMVAGSKSQRQCEVLFDTGASACFVREAIASQLG